MAELDAAEGMESYAVDGGSQLYGSGRMVPGQVFVGERSGSGMGMHGQVYGERSGSGMGMHGQVYGERSGSGMGMHGGYSNMGPVGDFPGSGMAMNQGSVSQSLTSLGMEGSYKYK